MKNFSLWLLIFSFGVFAEADSQSRSQRAKAFTGAVIIDGNGGVPIENGVLVVRGEKVQAVGPAGSVQIPPDIEIEDLGGKVVMPGLADMHLHFSHGWDGKTTDLLGYQRYLNALLYCGVTTVLDTGNTSPFILQVRDEIAAGHLLGPRLYCAGPLVDGPDPLWPTISYSISSVEQVPGLVRRLKQDRVDIIKAYVGLSDSLISALVREAKKNSLTLFVDQSWRNGSLELVMGDGVTAFAHAPDFPPSPEAITMMKPRGVMFITTLSVVESYSRRRLADLAFLDSPLIKDTTPSAILAALRTEAARQLDEGLKGSIQHNSQRLKMRSTDVKTLFEAGFLMAAGTDAPYPGVFQGEGIHRELELLVEAGLRPLDALTLATRNAAKIIGAEAEWGTLEAGKLANILIINGRPDQRITDTRNIESVILRGTALDREKLRLKTDPGLQQLTSVVAP